MTVKREKTVKYIASLTILALLALAPVSAARAQPTDNSELGLPPGSAAGSDYWADVLGDRHAPSYGVRYRSGGVRGGVY